MSENTSLLFEIGCEEIPARFLEGAERDLGASLGAALFEARLLNDAGAVKTYSTPRRLAVYVPALYSKQPGRVEEIIGPPVKVAFDREGKPTRAAESFAAKNNAKVSVLKRVTNAKGEYLALEVSEAGKPALQVLVEVLPSVLGGMTFPKNMYWTAKAGPLFIRPIRWILALLDKEYGEGAGGHASKNVRVVPFEFAEVKSGNLTYGHRLQGNLPIAITDLNLDLFLEKHLVVVHGPERRERVQQGIKALLEGTGLVAAADEFLETWVVNSTEWPVPLMGSFDPRYLALPREVLVTVMRDHQKYFAVEDEAGNLKPHFITVLNVPGDPKGLIRQGHERVLAARFADAEFFWNADQRVTLAERIPMLERVTYQAKLGTYTDKVKRMKALAEKVCAELEKSGSMNAPERQHALRAVELCKCDLTTQMVQEFPELQGIMGGLYAKSQGEPVEVADAIYDHYRPAGVEDSCPRSIAGVIVSLADKLDSVVAGFSAGLDPTGSSDPFGLRRAGNGIIKILIEKSLPVRVGHLFRGQAYTDWLARAYSFLDERLGTYLETVRGFPYDTVRAVLRTRIDDWDGHAPHDALDALYRADALEAIRYSEDFVVLAQAAKRIRNILVKSTSSADTEFMFKEDLLEHGPERQLYEAYSRALEQIEQARRDYERVFSVLASLKGPVDSFFEHVLVMHHDKDVRRNRVLLLWLLDIFIFSKFADLSEIVPSNVGAPTLKASGQA